MPSAVSTENQQPWQLSEPKTVETVADFLLAKPVSFPLEAEWVNRGYKKIASQRHALYTAALPREPQDHWVVSAQTGTTNESQPWETMVCHWIEAFQEARASSERQLASYRFIFQLLQSPLRCYVLDLRQIALTHGDSEKQADLQAFLHAVGVYWPLQRIVLHPDDGALPDAVLQVFREHQLLHQALHATLTMDWLYWVPYLDDIVQQAFLTSFWLLDRTARLMTGKSSAFETKVSDWPMDETIFDKIAHWPKILERVSQPDSPSRLIHITTLTEWTNAQRELFVAFTSLQITVEKKIERILSVLTSSKPTLNESEFLALNTYIALYQLYATGHQALRRLSPSELMGYQPHQLKKTTATTSNVPFSWSTLFSSKPANQTPLSFPYDQLSEHYRKTQTLHIQSEPQEASLPFRLMPALVRQWEIGQDAQKASLSAEEKIFILYTVVRPQIGQLSLTTLALSTEARVNATFFLEQLLTYNPHLVEICLPTDWGDVSQPIQERLDKNQQWRAALYYGSLSKAGYDNAAILPSLSDTQRYRKSLAVAYSNIATPWIKQTLRASKSVLPESDFNALKTAFDNAYLPTITAMSSQRQTPNINPMMRYDSIFKAYRPREQDHTLKTQIRAESLGFR